MLSISSKSAVCVCIGGWVYTMFVYWSERGEKERERRGRGREEERRRGARGEREREGIHLDTSLVIFFATTESLSDVN